MKGVTSYLITADVYEFSGSIHHPNKKVGVRQEVLSSSSAALAIKEFNKSAELTDYYIITDIKYL